MKTASGVREIERLVLSWTWIFWPSTIQIVINLLVHIYMKRTSTSPIKWPMCLTSMPHTILTNHEVCELSVCYSKNNFLIHIHVTWMSHCSLLILPRIYLTNMPRRVWWFPWTCTQVYAFCLCVSLSAGYYTIGCIFCNWTTKDNIYFMLMRK